MPIGGVAYARHHVGLFAITVVQNEEVSGFVISFSNNCLPSNLAHGLSISNTLVHTCLKGRLSTCHINWAGFNVSDNGVEGMDMADREHGK